MRIHPVVLAGTLILAGACTDPAGLGAPPRTLPSTVSLSYEGVGATGTMVGSYRAEGDPDLDRPQVDQTFADGRRLRGAGVLQISTRARRTEDLDDFASITLPRLAVGTVAIDRACGASHCPEVFLALELRRVHGSQARFSCSLDSGTMRLTAISGERARGEFSGTGVCLGGPGAGDVEPFRITDGRFDVKLCDVQS